MVCNQYSLRNHKNVIHNFQESWTVFTLFLGVCIQKDSHSTNICSLNENITDLFVVIKRSVREKQAVHII